MDVLEEIDRYPLPILDFSNKRIFIGNLLFIYACMIASEDLIEEALKHELPEHLRAYYEQHLIEEHNHALWLKDDLSSFGVTPTLDWNAAQIVGTQYYLIKHVDPKALLGYMAALECRPASIENVEYLEGLYGTEVMRCMRYHAVHDKDHKEDLLALIDTFDDKSVIIRNAVLTAQVIGNTLNFLQIG